MEAPERCSHRLLTTREEVGVVGGWLWFPGCSAQPGFGGCARPASPVLQPQFNEVSSGSGTCRGHLGMCGRFWFQSLGVEGTINLQR